jgi:glycerol dehydrogenase
MLKIMTSPGRYIQGYNVIGDFAGHVSSLGKHPFIIGGKTALSQIQDRIMPGLESAGMKYSFSVFKGKGTKKDVSDLVAEAKKTGADIITGIGGGLVIDTAKAVAHQTGLPLTVVPTVASTDAPCSSAALLYTEDHVIDEIVLLKRNPDLVLVDTRIIVEAPTRFFVAGIGDALSTWFEANTCEMTGAKNLADARPTAAGTAIAKLTYDTLMRYGESAKMAVDLNTVTPAVEMVIEANCLLSSIGFENCGLGAAHSFGVGVGTLKGTEDRLHGELVGFGVIANLIIENYPKEEIDKVLKFSISVGLPVTLDELGVEDQSRENLQHAGKSCFGPGSNMQNLAFDVTAELATDIIIAADALGRRYKG